MATRNPDTIVRTALWVTAPANVGVAALMLVPASLPGLLVGLPEPAPHVFYRALIAMLLGLFGCMYAWIALQPQINRPMVGLGAIGKGSFALTATALWIGGAVPWRLMALAAGDLVFVGIFVWWLTRESA